MILLSGCGEVEEAPYEAPEGEMAPMEGAEMETDLTEDEYIEIVARMQQVQTKYQDEFSAALEEGDTAEVERIQNLFQEESDDILDDMNISIQDVTAFESQNPGFLEDPQVQQRVMEKIEEIE